MISLMVKNPALQPHPEGGCLLFLFEDKFHSPIKIFNQGSHPAIQLMVMIRLSYILQTQK